MKQFNRIMIGVILLWIIMSGISAIVINKNYTNSSEKEYLVEVNRIDDLLTKQKNFSGVDTSDCSYIKQMDYLPAGQLIKMRDFFKGKAVTEVKAAAVPKQYSFYIVPYILNDKLQGYVRYSYITKSGGFAIKSVIMTEVLLGMIFLSTLGLLIYIRQVILKPFNVISELPLELSKGHLSKGLKETKNRYFGRFLWGLNQLRESLEEHRQKELTLEKNKKMMILSISHDIKTPLSTIKLYSRALYDNIYDTEGEKEETARKIEQKADQIEQFVAEIIKTSTSELFEFDVVIREIYLSSLIEAIRNAYEEKLKLLKTEFTIEPFKDKILEGNLDRLMDVFDNIIQNAIKYGDGRKITVSFAEEDNCQLIRVFNSGHSVSSPNLHHMFESFWRGENAIGKQGNGLGLYISKQLMHKMKGEIFAEASEEGLSIIIVLNKG